MKTYLSNLKKVNPIYLLVIGLILGFLGMYLLLEPKLVYQEKTAKQWVSKYNNLENYKCTKNDVKNYIKTVASAEAYKAGKSKTVDFTSMSWNAVDKCSSAFEAYQQYEINNPPITSTPTPTPQPSQNSNSNMPSWCPGTIRAYENAYLPLHYSQAAINEIIKQNNPECATY